MENWHVCLCVWRIDMWKRLGQLSSFQIIKSQAYIYEHDNNTQSFTSSV